MTNMILSLHPPPFFRIGKNSQIFSFLSIFLTPQNTGQWILYLQNCQKRRKSRESMWLAHILLLGELEKAHFKRCRLYLGIAQIAGAGALFFGADLSKS